MFSFYLLILNAKMHAMFLICKYNNFYGEKCARAKKK